MGTCVFSVFPVGVVQNRSPMGAQGRSQKPIQISAADFGARPWPESPAREYISCGEPVMEARAEALGKVLV